MIETYNETTLHLQLKNIFCPTCGKKEVPVNNFVCDIFFPQNNIIEIQTANLINLKKKLTILLPYYKIQIIYPISLNTYITMYNNDGSIRHSRKSPKHGNFFQIFKEIAPISHFLNNQNLTITIAYIESSVKKIDDKKGKSKYKNPRITDRSLIKLIKTEDFNSLNELTSPILKNLPNKFQSCDLKKNGTGIYTYYIISFLKKINVIEKMGIENRKYIYKKSGIIL